MSERPAGPILDGLGVVFDLQDDDLIVEAVVIGKITRLSDGGGTTIVIANSEGIDWVSQLGLIEAARQVTQGGGMEEAP
jgi:hypothetical protein